MLMGGSRWYSVETVDLGVPQIPSGDDIDLEKLVFSTESSLGSPILTRPLFTRAIASIELLSPSTEVFVAPKSVSTFF